MTINLRRMLLERGFVRRAIYQAMLAAAIAKSQPAQQPDKKQP